MEAAIRWSPHGTTDQKRFLKVDVRGNALELCEIDSMTRNKLEYHAIARQDKIPNFSAFDWSKTDEPYVAIGEFSGDARVLRLSPDEQSSDAVHHFPIRHQRKCNSIAFSTQNLLAVALDRVRNHFCLNVFDVNADPRTNREPYRKLCSSETVSSVKFFAGQPNELLAAVSRQCIRLFDLRDPQVAGLGQVVTKQVNNIAIDPLDENYFASAGATGDTIVVVWDRRFILNSGTTASENLQSGSVLEFCPVVDNSRNATVWSVRYSGTKRGCFGVLSNDGELKLYETAQHAVKSSSPSTITNDLYGGHTWTSPHYTRRTHQLQYPFYSAEHGGEESSRVVAFDFVHDVLPAAKQQILALRPNLEVCLLQAPGGPSHAIISGCNELMIGGPEFLSARPSTSTTSVAKDILHLSTSPLAQRDCDPSEDLLHGEDSEGPSIRLARLNFNSDAADLPGKRTQKSRRSSSVPDSQALLTLCSQISEPLFSLTIQQRRCQEGYSFDCEKNIRIVADSPGLAEMWTIIHRMESLAQDGKMVYTGLDLSFLGISSIWRNDLGISINRLLNSDDFMEAQFHEAINLVVGAKQYPQYEGVRTQFPDHRKLCLDLCGWVFTKNDVEAKCQALIDQRQYYKAIVLAVFHGFKNVALVFLRELIRERKLEKIGIGAIIAFDTVNEEQRAECRWMQEETEDPYVQALLTYFVSGDWQAVVDLPQLALVDRIGIALKHLEDDRLGTFLKRITDEVATAGIPEGVLLTGLSEQATDLFQAYITRTNDLQTAVLAMAFTSPLYVDDIRWTFWKETYDEQMQVWRAFTQRTIFTVEHSRRAITRDGRKLIEPPPRQTTVRCNQCQGSIAKTHPNAASATTTSSSTKKPRTVVLGEHAGTVCPRCGRHLPRCGICMMWLGTSNPSAKGGVGEIERDGGRMARYMTFCMSCGHGFHSHHAKMWFGRHAMCPVPDCQCMCGLKQ
ncbi:hypothetical protein LTR66_013725 [Elasticomyces elasticus]|nr:hypothetical protein LTR66_013725 [Elasticomyces elasticus]